MGFIPEEVLQQIQDTADIRQVVQEYVPLKKRGRNWVGLCPFHSDKDPSFSVSEDKQIFYCFGCGEGGDVFKFLMRMEGLSFAEAARTLAERYGIEIPKHRSGRAGRRRKEERQALLEINEAAKGFFAENLRNPKVGALAQQYISRRGLSPEVVEQFRLGWAPDAWDSLVNFFKDRGFDHSLAEKAGLIVQRSNAPGYYDRFRGRIIFPILDHRGHTVAFGGRIIAENPEIEQPKYLNSPETPVYHKGRVLYGLFQNRDSIRRAGRGVVVEGYMDLISLYQAGVKEAVATLGTALTEDQVRRMKGIARNWVLLFDGDEAGRKAAKRALPIFYRFNLSPRVLELPEGEDPDSFVRKEGKDALYQMMDGAPSGIDFLLDTGVRIYGDDVDGRHRTAEEALEVVAAIEDPVRKSLIIGHVAQRIGLRETSLWERLRADERRLARRRRAVSAQAANEDADGTDPARGSSRGRIGKGVQAEEKLLGFLLGHSSVIGEFLDEKLELWLQDQDLRRLWQAVVNLYNMEGCVEISALSKSLEGLSDLKALAMRLASEAPPCSSLDEMVAALKEYCRERRKRALRQELMDQMRMCGPDEGEILLRQIQGLI